MMASSDCVSFHVSKLSRQKLNDETVRSVGPALESAHLPWSALILVAARSFATGGTDLGAPREEQWDQTEPTVVALLEPELAH